jgi:hypothetical protein
MKCYKEKMTNSLINTSNWNYCYFKSQDNKAFISFGASFDPAKPDQITECYYVNLTTMENKDLFQRSFPKLELALDFINSSYEHFDFTNPTLKDKSGGCDSCQAH